MAYFPPFFVFKNGQFKRYLINHALLKMVFIINNNQKNFFVNTFFFGIVSFGLGVRGI